MSHDNERRKKIRERQKREEAYRHRTARKPVTIELAHTNLADTIQCVKHAQANMAVHARAPDDPNTGLGPEVVFTRYGTKYKARTVAVEAEGVWVVLPLVDDNLQTKLPFRTLELVYFVHGDNILPVGDHADASTNAVAGKLDGWRMQGERIVIAYRES